MASHDKSFIFWSKSSGEYSTLRSILQRDGWDIFIAATGKSLLEFSSQTTDQAKRISCLAILNPSEKLSPHDVDAIRQFISAGHKAIVANSADERESPSVSNLNKLMALFGIRFNHDCIIRPNPYGLYHPKEALLEDFIVNRGLEDALKKYTDKKKQEPGDEFLFKSAASQPRATTNQTGFARAGPRVIYPKGCTLRVTSKSAYVMMTSSKWTIPSHKPICAFYRDAASNDSRLIALGSASMLNDKFIDKEDDRSLVCGLLEFITKDDFYINMSDARTIEIAKNNMTPNMDKLVGEPICCLQQLEPLPDDKSSLINRRLFSIDNTKLPQVIRAYKDLGVPNEPLTLMRPLIDWNLESGLTKEPSKDQIKLLFKCKDGKMRLM